MAGSNETRALIMNDNIRQRPRGLLDSTVAAAVVGLFLVGMFPDPRMSARAEGAGSGPEAALAPVVEVENVVYAFTNANNGAGPMWCSGSTPMVRVGGSVFAAGLETLAGVPPLNNCRWQLFGLDGGADWRVLLSDAEGRTREPSPMVTFDGGRFFLSANPTLGKAPEPGGGPARPTLLEFSAKDPGKPVREVFPGWKGAPRFSEHSYRSFAADGSKRELILFQNIDYTHAEWAFMDSEGAWSAQGQLKWPWGAEYAKPQPIRVCYPNVALKDRQVFFCGVSDVVEPNPAWRAFKKELTGKEWDYDFRRLFFTWTPDIKTEGFKPWIEVASREATCGWISPGDLFVAGDGTVHIVWTERALDERLRAKFFPDARQSHELHYATIKGGVVTTRRTLYAVEEGKPGLVASAARFQPAPGGELYLVCYVQGTDASGKGVSENRIQRVGAEGLVGAPARIPLKTPFVSYFTATPRAGSAPSRTLDMLGMRSGSANEIAYARVRF